MSILSSRQLSTLSKRSGNFRPPTWDAHVADTRRNGGSMFRIYRDTRFFGDKRPYRENVGRQFRHTAECLNTRLYQRGREGIRNRDAVDAFYYQRT